MAALIGIVEQIVYIKCFTNNLAGMFLRYLMDGIQEFGIPSQARWDKGIENVNVTHSPVTSMT